MTSKIKEIWGYLNSWEFWLSLALWIVFVVFDDGQWTRISWERHFAEASIAVTVIGIFFTVSSLSVTILVANVPRRFGEFLERQNRAYSGLVNVHLWGLVVYLLTLLIWAACSLVGSLKIVQYIHLAAVFMTAYSFFYTFEILRHLSMLIRAKRAFDELSRGGLQPPPAARP